MNELNELRMIRERIEQEMAALAEIEGAARQAARMLAVLTALACGATAMIFIAVLALLRLVERGGF